VGLYRGAALNAIKAARAERADPYLAEAKALARTLGDSFELAMVHETEGLYALLTGDAQRAKRAFAEQLRICRDRQIVQEAPPGLAGMAATAAAEGDGDRAARLLGAATALGPIGDRDVVGQLEERFFTRARADHGEGAWDDAARAGANLGFDEAIALAIG
jgi:hypothetical protein